MVQEVSDVASRAGALVRWPQQVEEEEGGGRFRPLCGGRLYDWRGFTPLVTAAQGSEIAPGAPAERAVAWMPAWLVEPGR